MSSFLSAALSQSFVTGPCTKVQRKNNTHKGPPISQRTRPPFYASYPAPPLVKGLQGLVHGTVNKAGLVGICQQEGGWRRGTRVIVLSRRMKPFKYTKSARQQCHTVATTLSPLGASRHLQAHLGTSLTGTMAYMLSQRMR